MSPTTTAVPTPVVPPEVLAYAEEQGVSQYLAPLVELTKQVYPTATRFEVLVEDDPEIPRRYVVFDVDVPLTVEQSLTADHRWHEGWMRIYPYPRSCSFCLSVNLP